MRFRVGTFTANAKREFVPRETKFSLYLTFTVDCLCAEISTDSHVIIIHTNCSELFLSAHFLL